MIVATLVALAAGHVDLLVGSPGTSAARIAADLQPYGTLVGRDEGLWKVNLRGSLNAEVVAKKLRQRGMRFVLSASAARLNNESLVSVKQHIAYMRAQAEVAGDDEKEEAAEWLEAYEAYLKPRVDAYGMLDRDGNGRAVQQRDALPAAKIGGQGGTHGPTGTFTLVGPKSTDVPYPKMGKAPISGRKNEVKWAPSNPEVMWTTSAGGGAWKSNDGGTTWACKSNDLNWDAQACDGLAIDPSNPNIVYVGTGDDDKSVQKPWGVMKTSNGGTSWTNVGRTDFGSDIITELYVPPSATNVVLALTSNGGSGRVLRSTDSGLTWTVTNAPSGKWEDYDVSSTGTIYICGQSTSGSARIYKSTNNGSTWTSVGVPSGLTSETATDIACSKLNTSRMYLFSASTNDVYKTTNGGTSWSHMNIPQIAGDWDQDTYDYYVETSTNGALDRIYVGLKTINSSKDGGATWVDLTKSQDPVDSRIHTDQHCMAVHPANPDLLLVGNDGGVFLLDHNAIAGTISWSSLNESFTDALCYHIALHPTNSNYIMTGCQDLATPSSLGNLSNWSNLMGGDGTWCQFNPNTPDVHYSSEQKLDIHKYATPNTKTDTPISPAWSSVAFVAPFVFGGSTFNTMFGGANKKLQQYSGNGTNWTPGPFQVTAGGEVLELAVAPSNGNIIYTGSDDGKVFRVDVSTNTYTDLTISKPWGSTTDIQAIAVNPTNSNEILVGLAGYSPTRLYKCANTTAGTITWTAVSGSGNLLPEAPVNGIAYDPFNPGTWYVASDVGLFMTTSYGYNWANMSPLGLPNVHCEDVAVHPATHALYVGTFGRGIWKIGFTNISFTSVTLDHSSVYERSTARATVRISAAAPPGTTATMLDFSSALDQPTSVIFTTGATSASWTMTTHDVTSTTNVDTLVSLMGTTKTVTLTIEPYPHVSTVSVNPNSIYGGSNATVTITLNHAGPLATTVFLADDSPNITVPATATIGAGQSSINVTATTTPLSTTTLRSISATVDGVSVAGTVTLKQPLLTSLTLVPQTVIGGNPSTGTVHLSSNAPTSGVVVTLSESSAFTSVPSQVTVVSGNSTATFTVTTTHPLLSVNSTISATNAGTTRTATLHINP